jgi:hypothetical protein
MRETEDDAVDAPQLFDKDGYFLICSVGALVVAAAFIPVIAGEKCSR